MTLNELYTLLITIPGFDEEKIAYRFFPREKVPELPYIVYLETSTDNFSADNIVYHKIQNVDIELYTKNKDMISEEAVETLLNANSIFWEKSEDYLDSEQMYMITYSIQI